MKTFAKKLPVYFLTCLLFCAALLAPMGSGKASAASDLADPPSSIEETNVLDDLEGSVLNGNKFDISDWGFNGRRDLEVVSFVEFGYSIYASRQDDYGLFVYIYNPQGFAIDTNTDYNKIELQAGNTEITRYPLIFLNYSDRAGTEGMFYKFKVSLPESKRIAILNSLQQDAREYKITQVDISVKGVLKTIKSATTYTYSGYAQGYGSELAPESTLVCTTDGFEDYAELEVHQTVYRPQGDYYEGEQSQLNSCYFRVPEKYFENYGTLSKVVCDWYEYVTKPVLVTTDRELYNFYYNLHGGDVPSANAGTAYVIFHAKDYDSMLWGGIAAYGGAIVTNCEEIEDDYAVGVLGMGGYMKIDPDNYAASSYGGDPGILTHGLTDNDLLEGYSFNPENYYSAVFYTKSSYKGFIATADELEERLYAMSDQLGGPYLPGGYSATLFSDDIYSGRERGYNHREIKPNDPRQVFSNSTVKNLWQDYFGGYTLNTDFQEIKAIHEVTAEDLKGSDEEIAERLYIGKRDIDDLKAEFDKAKLTNDHVVLLRYADSVYSSIPFYVSDLVNTQGMAQNEVDDEVFHSLLWKLYNKDEFDGYVAQETVYLDFKIISLNFLKNGVETVIPVVMTPQNVFSDITPPLEKNFHSGLPGGLMWLIIVILAVLLIIVLVLFFPVLRPIFTAVIKVLWWIITAPFRFIAWIIKKIHAAVKKRKEAKAAAPPKAPNPPDPDPPKSSKSKRASEEAVKTDATPTEQHIILEIRRQPKAPQAKSKGGKNEKNNHKTKSNKDK